MGKISIYTDGAAKGNPGPGGYGVVLEYKGHRKEISEGFKITTNNRMELLAVIVGIEAIKESGHQITIYSDSKYVVDAINKKWVFNWEKKQFKKKKNSDLWIRFLKIYRKHDIRLKWIKGHSGHIQNERCDLLAVTASNKIQLLNDTGYELNQNNPTTLFD
tara:strand:+ start:2466 stop:2948 length:483 start_codon:yes stop_codon:yes gene_type:complete